MQSVLEGLRRSEKGQLTYYTDWSPKDIAKDIPPPIIHSYCESPIFKVSDTRLMLEAIEDEAFAQEKSLTDEKEKEHVKDDKKDSESEELPTYQISVYAPLKRFELALKEQRWRSNFERERKREKFNAELERERKEHVRKQQEQRREKRIRAEEQQKRYLRETQESAMRIKQEEQQRQDNLLKTRQQQQEERRLQLQLLEIQKQKENFSKFLKLVQESQELHKENLQKVHQLQGGPTVHISESQLSRLVEDMNVISSKTNSSFSASKKVEKVTEEDLARAESGLEILKKFSKSLSQEINFVKLKIMKEKEQAEKAEQELIAKKKQQEAEKEKKIAEEAAKLQTASSQPSASTAPSTSKAAKSLPLLSDIYKALQTKMEEYESAGSQLTKSSNRDMKMLAMNLSRAISVPVSSITDRSGSDVKSRLRILVNIIKGNTVSVGSKSVSTKGNENAVKFAVNLTARKIVSQANDQVSANFTSAFSIAFMVLGIWAESPEFGDLFLAHLHARCIFCVPMYLLKKDSQSEEEHQKQLGYIVSEDGTVEQQDKYLRRMSGLVRLYAAVIQSPLPPGVSVHPHGLSKGWAWLAEVLNSEPQPDVSATVLYDFLEVAGHALMKSYKTQFEKLLYVICHDYYPKLEEVTSPSHRAPLMRLKTFLEKCIAEKSVPVPKGRLEKSFWNTYHSGEVVGE